MSQILELLGSEMELYRRESGINHKSSEVFFSLFHFTIEKINDLF